MGFEHVDVDLFTGRTSSDIEKINAGMENSLSELPMLLWTWWLFTILPLALATRSQVISLLRAAGFRVAAKAPDGFPCLSGLKFSVCLQSVGLNLDVVQQSVVKKKTKMHLQVSGYTSSASR